MAQIRTLTDELVAWLADLEEYHRRWRWEDASAKKGDEFEALMERKYDLLHRIDAVGNA